MSVDIQGYAEVLSGFTEATASTQERSAVERRISVSLDASSNPEVALPFSSLLASSMLLPCIIFAAGVLRHLHSKQAQAWANGLPSLYHTAPYARNARMPGIRICSTAIHMFRCQCFPRETCV